MPFLQTLANGDLLLALHVQPGATRTEFAGMHGESLKLRLAALPIDGKANKAAVRFIAELFRLPHSAVAIKSGLRSRDKKFLLTGIAESEARSLIEPNQENNRSAIR